MPQINTVFFDIGGVLLTNGWDHEQRETIAAEFGFDYSEFDARHRQVVDSLERGQITFTDYLDRTVFYTERRFTRAHVLRAAEGLSQPLPDSLDIVRLLRARTGLSLFTLNNESRELNDFRIRTFNLDRIFSAFFTSCYLGTVKPQPEHFLKALEITHRSPEECAFVDDRPLNVEMGRSIGMEAIRFTSPDQLRKDLSDIGIVV